MKFLIFVAIGVLATFQVANANCYTDCMSKCKGKWYKKAECDSICIGKCSLGPSD